MWNAYIVMTYPGVGAIEEDEWVMMAIFHKGHTYDGKSAYRAAKAKRDEVMGVWTHAKVIKAVVLQVFNA